jgi:hypothetical protein
VPTKAPGAQRLYINCAIAKAIDNNYYSPARTKGDPMINYLLMVAIASFYVAVTLVSPPPVVVLAATLLVAIAAWACIR